MVSTAGGGFGNGVGRKRSWSGVDHLDLDFPHIDKRFEDALGCLRKPFDDDHCGAMKGPMCQGEYGTFLPVDIQDPVECAHHLKTQLKRYEDSKLYCMAIATLEDARSIKILANRLKALEVDISKIYLEGALTFLKGASLLEDCIVQGERPRETNYVFYHYRDAARFFRYSAATYEKNGKPETAALVYKCLEFVYMRIVHLLSTAPTKSVIFERSSEKKADGKLLLCIGDHARCAINAGRRSHRILELSVQQQQSSQGCISSVKRAIDCVHYDVGHFIHLVNLALKDTGM